MTETTVNWYIAKKDYDAVKKQRDELVATVREVQTEMNGIWSQQPYIAKWEKILLESIAKAGDKT